MKCCFDDCSLDIGKWGHNAKPLMDGKCCDVCNFQRVIPARLMAVMFQ
jgi:hypothetical protein